MRPSKLKHPVAVLRGIIGLGQKELAALVGCTASTIQSVELGKDRLPLSENLAQKISLMTGVGVAWLLAGDPKAPPTRNDGRPYGKADYEQVRAEMLRSPSRTNSGHLHDFGRVFFHFHGYEAILAGCLIQALRDDRVFLLLYRLNEFFAQLQKEFPCAPQTDEIRETLEAMRDALASEEKENWFETHRQYLVKARARIDELVGGEFSRLTAQLTGPMDLDTRRGTPEPDFDNTEEKPTPELLAEIFHTAYLKTREERAGARPMSASKQKRKGARKTRPTSKRCKPPSR